MMFPDSLQVTLAMGAPANTYTDSDTLASGINHLIDYVYGIVLSDSKQQCYSTNLFFLIKTAPDVKLRLISFKIR